MTIITKTGWQPQTWGVPRMRHIWGCRDYLEFMSDSEMKGTEKVAKDKALLRPRTGMSALRRVWRKCSGGFKIRRVSGAETRHHKIGPHLMLCQVLSEILRF